MATKRTRLEVSTREETISAVAHAALELALRGLSADRCERIHRLNIGDFDRAAAAFVRRLLAQDPAPEPAA